MRAARQQVEVADAELQSAGVEQGAAGCLPAADVARRRLAQLEQAPDDEPQHPFEQRPSGSRVGPLGVPDRRPGPHDLKPGRFERVRQAQSSPGAAVGRARRSAAVHVAMVGGDDSLLERAVLDRLERCLAVVGQGKVGQPARSKQGSGAGREAVEREASLPTWEESCAAFAQILERAVAGTPEEIRGARV